jgi:hypothetical protein
MSDHKKPLPKPPGKAFGPGGNKKRFGEESQQEELIADKMGMAMATGKIDDFMDNEFKGNDNAKKLASMMMGMSGMGAMGGAELMPPGVMPESPAKKPDKTDKTENAPSPDEKSASPADDETSNEHTVENPSEPSKEIINATMSGDTQALAQMLKEEFTKRQGGQPAPVSPEKDSLKLEPAGDSSNNTKEAAGHAEGQAEGQIEKHLLLKLIKIASDNDVTIDWVINRALKLYVRDHEGTGRV